MLLRTQNNKVAGRKRREPNNSGSGSAVSKPPNAKKVKKGSNNNNEMKGGYKGCVRKEGDIYYDTPEPKSEDAKYYESLLETKCPSDAVLESIERALRERKVASSSSAATASPLTENIKETIFTILYPYFKAYGAFTVNKYFYDWAVNTILVSISNEQQFVPFNQFEDRFVEIHSGVNINNPNTYISKDYNDKGNVGTETVALTREGLLLGTMKKGPSGSPLRASGSSSSGSPLIITPHTGTHATTGTAATLTGMSALRITTPGSTISVGQLNGSQTPSHEAAQALNFTKKKSGGKYNRKTRLRRKSSKICKYRKTRKLRRNKSTK